MSGYDSSTGHCWTGLGAHQTHPPLRLSVDDLFRGPMRVKFQTEIDAPRTAVWRLVTDIENAATHIAGIEKVEVLERPKDGFLGFKWRETRTMFGKTATEVMWITDAVEATRYDTRAESHGAIYTTRITLEQRAGRTLLSKEFEGKAVTFGAKVMWGLMGWMFKRATRKALQKDLEDIKHAVEGKAGRAG